MTPFELSLESELNREWQRFANEWLFQWHNLNIEGHAVDVDRFDGGRIHYGGIRFGSQQQQVFWQAIGLYLNQTIHGTFKRWDVETRAYPNNVRRVSIDGLERNLKQFVAKIVQLSTETDGRLRGQGYPQNVAPINSAGHLSRANFEVLRLAEAHRALIDESIQKQRGRLSHMQRLEDFLSNHKGIMAAIAIAVAIIFGVVRLLWK